jgi:hypothetical protein
MPVCQSTSAFCLVYFLQREQNYSHLNVLLNIAAIPNQTPGVGKKIFWRLRIQI